MLSCISNKMLELNKLTMTSLYSYWVTFIFVDFVWSLLPYDVKMIFSLFASVWILTEVPNLHVEESRQNSCFVYWGYDEFLKEKIEFWHIFLLHFANPQLGLNKQNVYNHQNYHSLYVLSLCENTQMGYYDFVIHNGIHSYFRIVFK